MLVRDVLRSRPRRIRPNEVLTMCDLRQDRDGRLIPTKKRDPSDEVDAGDSQLWLLKLTLKHAVFGEVFRGRQAFQVLARAPT